MELFKIKKEFQGLPAEIESKLADYVAKRREEYLGELRVIGEQSERLQRENYLLYRKNEELMERQL